jgi:hypothetical protein
MVIPDGQHEHHAVVECLAHVSVPALGRKRVRVAESRLLCSAEWLGDRIVGGHSRDVRLGVLDDLAVLDIETTDLFERARGSVVGGDELGDHGHLLGGVESEALAVKGLVAHAVRVEVAAGLVAVTRALCARAACLTRDCARMRGICGGNGVALPDVHLVAASAVAAGARVGIVGRAGPVEDISLRESILV